MFKKKFSFKQRQAESARIRAQFPDRVPVIISRAPNCKDVKDLDRHKFLVPAATSVSSLLHIIRKRIRDLPAEKSIYLFINETVMPASSAMLVNIYDEHQDEDGFLYVVFAAESTFGFTC